VETRAFRVFIDAEISARSPWTDLSQHLYFGDEAFIERTQAQMLDARRRPEIPRPQRMKMTLKFTRVTGVIVPNPCSDLPSGPVSGVVISPRSQGRVTLTTSRTRQAGDMPSRPC
jgi:hypothetical protein